MSMVSSQNVEISRNEQLPCTPLEVLVKNVVKDLSGKCSIGRSNLNRPVVI